MDRFSNINNILAFVTVAREGSVSRAAEVLNLTQPAISHQVKRLSEETGVTLFERTANGLQISADGAALLPAAEQVLDSMRDFRRSARQRAGTASGKLRVGTIVDPEFIRLGQLLSTLRAHYPQVETELSHGVSGDIRTRLQKNQIDAGFFLCGPDDFAQLSAGPEDPLRVVRLAQFDYRVIAPVGWQSRLDGANWATLAAYPWIGTPEVSVHHRLLAKIFVDQGQKQNVVALVDQEASMLEMVRSGVGLSLCRDAIALYQRQSHGIAVADHLTVPACLCLIMLERRVETPMLSALVNVLDEVW